MTFITFRDGKVVMRDDKVGTEQACCCNCCTLRIFAGGYQCQVEGEGGEELTQFFCDWIAESAAWYAEALESLGYAAAIANDNNDPCPNHYCAVCACSAEIEASCVDCHLLDRVVPCTDNITDYCFPSGDYENNPDFVNILTINGGPPTRENVSGLGLLVPVFGMLECGGVVRPLFFPVDNGGPDDTPRYWYPVCNALP